MTQITTFKKITISAITVAMLFGAAFTGMASAAAVVATTTATTTATSTTPVVATTTATTTPPATGGSTIAALLAQLAKLTELFNNLKAQMMGVTAEIKELRGDIKEGMTDADVKTIQELLASDPSIYPRGLVTGYFGPMTKEAIMRFQTRNGLEVTGEINEETRAALDTVIEQRRGQGKFPVGLLIAKQRFEYRLKLRCGDDVAATSTATTTSASTTPSLSCTKVKVKYKFWHEMKDEEKDMKDEMKDEMKDMKKMMHDQKKDMKNNASSSKMMDDEDDN